jgi:hypothetical protein
MTSGSRMRLAVWGLCGLAALVGGSLPSASAAEAGDFVDTWVNLDAATEGITRVEIGIFKTSFTVHTWGSCIPECDWGTATVTIPVKLVDTFAVHYVDSFATRTLTIRLLSPELLRVHLLTDYTPEDGRTDFERDYYFSRKGSAVPKPDLTISAIWVDKPVVVYQAVPISYVRFTVKNLGPGMVYAQPFPVKVVNATRSGEAFVWTGFVQITSLPLLPGQSTEGMMAVGHNTAWPVGCYTLQLKVNPDGLVDEANTRNNVSAKISFDVAHSRFLAGTIRFNGNPLSNYIDREPDEVTIDNAVPSSENGQYFWYNPQTGHYLLSGMADKQVMIRTFFRNNHPTGLLPGDYYRRLDIDLNALTDEEAGSQDIEAYSVTHLLTPWDNSQLYGPGYLLNCPTTELTWEPVDGAEKYLVILHIFRDKEHPEGEGIVSQLIFTHVTEPSYVVRDLPVLPELMHYHIAIGAFSATGNLSYYHHLYQGGGAGTGYEFKVCPSCARADINRDCEVNLADLMILAQEWLVDTR